MMTKDTNLLTRTELLEVAAADALGLLDDFETEQFNRSFHNAPPAVQDEIKELQAEIVADTSLLPNIMPPEALRERVLEHLRKRILEENSELAPLATIGRFGHNLATSSETTRVSRRNLVSHDAWRGAAIILVGVVVAISIYAYKTNDRTNALLADVALNLQTQDQLKSYLGNDLDSFVANPSCIQVAMYSVERNSRGMGHLWVNQRDNEVFLITLDLPSSDGEFTLSAILSDGTELSNIVSFNSRPITGQRFAIDASQLVDATFMVTDATGNVVLSSNPTSSISLTYAAPPRSDHSAS
ncbi:MAG: hypothetical protein P8J86_04095 [Phycisphaerales bacterium]|jgi:hypothetical protein|nr:hypothetical protein [Phycisphaerales bacterium]